MYVALLLILGPMLTKADVALAWRLKEKVSPHLIVRRHEFGISTWWLARLSCKTIPAVGLSHSVAVRFHFEGKLRVSGGVVNSWLHEFVKGELLK